ncbi:MAG: iron ABC transporter permease [Phycisphaerae bacterium]|nr:iron ABC transporter permease [Phycisphaerae bacterium]
MNRAFTARRMLAFLGLSLLAYAAIGTICLCLGPGAMFQWDLTHRLARVVAASLVGGALSMAGVTFQALLRNPLASPSILGISTGASLGVILGDFLRLRAPDSSLAHVPPEMLALGFAVLTILLVYGLSQRRGHIDPLSLLLVGVMVSAFAGAVIMALNLMVPHGVRGNWVVWMMGMISQTTGWRTLGLAGGGIGIGFLVLLAMTQQFNLQALGEHTAQTLGVRVQWVRLVSFAAASAVTAVAVSISGPIGFVGLICPHICRRLFGPDHRILLIAATAFGAAFLASADTAVRALANVTGGEIPVGVLTAVCGGPFFIYLLRRHLRRRDA